MVRIPDDRYLPIEVHHLPVIGGIPNGTGTGGTIDPGTSSGPVGGGGYPGMG